MRNKNSVTSSLSNKGTLTDAQINAGFGFNTILKSPDLNGQLYDIDSQVNIITKEICNFLIDNNVTLNANDDTQLSVLLTQLFSEKQKALIAGSGITIDEDGTISTTAAAPANLPMFFNISLTFHPFNLSWVNSNNYSWLYASTYVSGYNLLIDQFEPVGTFAKGDSYYVCTFSDGEILTTSVPANSGTLQQLESWCTSQGYTYNTASTIEELECYKTLPVSSETVSGTTIQYYHTRNDMKIIDTTQIAACDTIFNTTGKADYYVLDTTNERFKLPRSEATVYTYYYLGYAGVNATASIAGINAEVINSKMDNDLGNIDPGVDFVVDWQLPSSDNNYTWYRKYRSGWVEQGGFVASTTTDYGTQTVILLIPMADTNYSVSVTPNTQYANTQEARGYSYYNRTVNGFDIYPQRSNLTIGNSWEVKGMAAD